MDDETVVVEHGSSEATQPPPAAPPKRALFSRVSPVTILLCILLAAVLAESVLLFRGNADARTRAEVLQTSSHFLGLVTTYNATNLDAQRAAVLRMATGKARSDYDQVTGAGLLSVLKDRQASSSGKVVRVSVETVGGDSATTLNLVTVTVTNKDIKTPHVEQDLIELSLVHTSAGWKIDAITILGQVTV